MKVAADWPPGALFMRHSVASRHLIANDLFTKTYDRADVSWHIGDGRAVIIASRCRARSLNLLNAFRLHQILSRFIVISSPCRNLRASSAIEPGKPRLSATDRAFRPGSAQHEEWNMHVPPLSRVFRRHSSSLPTAAALDEEGLKIGAALAWISQQGNLDDFPGSRNERLALMTTAIRRGLVAWDRGHDRYKLTQLGKMQTACYSPNIKWTKGPAQDSPAVKSALAVRLLDRFERRPYTMIAGFFAIGAAVGAAAAWAPSSALRDTRSALSANQQTSGDSAAPAVSNRLSASGSWVAAPQEQPPAADPPTSTAAAAPASPAQDGAVSTGNTSEPIEPRHMQEVDPPLQGPAAQQERAPTAALSGSVAATRAADHFDRAPRAEAAERAASATKLLDSQAIPEPSAVPETPPKSASHHRGRDAKARVGAERGPIWSQEIDGGRPKTGSRARRWPDFADEDRGTRRYNSYQNERDDPMGIVGWLFH
jgi:hypothetical protein